MLRQTRFKVLIVSDKPSFDTFCLRFLKNTRFEEPDITRDLSEARRLLVERTYDIVLINSPIKDSNGIDFAISVSDRYDCDVMIAVKNDLYHEAFDRTNHLGILCLSKPVQADLFGQSLRILTSTRERVTDMHSKYSDELSFAQKMAQIKLVNEAKLLIMKHERMTEEEAHKLIEKTSMDSRVSKTQIARSIIEKYSLA